MDTGTHVVMGIALGAVATAIDPAIVGSSAAIGIMTATIIGSQIPDIDTVLKLKNNADYIRNHRGITHSLPGLAIWPLLLSAILAFIFPAAPFWHLLLWTFVAVGLHIFVDIFNAYGTQALRPFKDTWVAFGFINTFDIFIFGSHVVAIVIWLLGAPALPTFFTLYAILALYYVARFITQKVITHAVKNMIPDSEEIIVASTIRFFQWRVAVTTKDHYYVGRAFKRTISIYEKFDRLPVPDNDIIHAAMKDKNLTAFVSFSKVYNWRIEEKMDGTYVTYTDLRYRSNGHYPFVAVVKLDDDLQIISSYTGWIFSDEKLHKKLHPVTD
ncbi:metal-dependent hydrolase [Listeria newyorkensis]|uniref:Metal-dependent hydrolase n=1 Tax=Listeria newyorkensis TaxID=1497681 RepID=A0ABX4XIB1_9LIST|nr:MULTISPECIES: metal-dependent hydrolase [Listeria]KGL46205.1 metal-dependent hydrolase [Listeriaceae bacterium FSL A5-0209]KGL43424.1 metal-dependent hydrolase [Listeria newyorkensis]KMT63068.1 membrane-bound metal-dependent hydrolase [Listeria newyorkensis]PNP88230.1 metal-dependent hydrolase [Listeria newyorkensis]RQW65500.1 metal-dependent hydrolase [Listeria sp. SHR_NRA_18]